MGEAVEGPENLYTRLGQQQARGASGRSKQPGANVIETVDRVKRRCRGSRP